MVTVLVVTHDAGLGETVKAALGQQGIEAILTDDSRSALQRIRDDQPDAMVLELFLADRSGFAVCKALREAPEGQAIPILMLSGSSAEMDRILALECGADDVLDIPFYPRELALRLRALIRRARGAARLLAPPLAQIEHGPLRLDGALEKLWVEGREVRLTDTELRILTLLLREPGRVFTRDEILARVWGGERERTLRVVDTHMKGIRRKLGASAAILESLRGVGYRVRDSAEEPKPGARRFGPAPRCPNRP